MISYINLLLWFQPSAVRLGSFESGNGKLRLEPPEVVTPPVRRGQQGQRAQRKLSRKEKDQRGGRKVSLLKLVRLPAKPKRLLNLYLSSFFNIGWLMIFSLFLLLTFKSPMITESPIREVIEHSIWSPWLALLPILDTYQMHPYAGAIHEDPRVWIGDPSELLEWV